MNNLTKQLANLYEPKWNELKQQLDAKGIKVQAPFMLGIALEHNNQGGYVDESWWTDADLKVMVFGKEPLNWPMPILDDGSQVQSDDFVELYQRFYSDNYKGNISLQILTTTWLRISSSAWDSMVSCRVSKTSFSANSIPTRK